jgi:hypothetical protein
MSEQPRSTESPTAGEDDAECLFPLRPSEPQGLVSLLELEPRS